MTHPPFDPELGAALAAVAERIPPSLSPAGIQTQRRRMAELRLSDEDVDYAVRIWRAGGQAELHVWPGAFHGFDGLAPDAVLSRAARQARIAWVARLLQAANVPPEEG
jgi:acetyl esterase/lipase